MKSQNLYRTLAISPTATQEEIKTSYRRLARQNHPDRGGSARAFQTLASAYAILSDPEQRLAYDRERAGWIAQMNAVPCLHCGEANRLGAIPTGQTPCCGLCGHPLPSASPKPAPWAVQAREFVLGVGERVKKESGALAVELGTALTARTEALLTETVDRGFAVLRERLGLRPASGPRR